MAEGAVLFRGLALPHDDELLRALDDVTAAAPFRALNFDRPRLTDRSTNPHNSLNPALIFAAKARSVLHGSDGADARTSPRYRPHRGSRKAETWSRPTLYPSQCQTRNPRRAKRRDLSRGSA
jgi:hypothetical protein